MKAEELVVNEIIKRNKLKDNNANLVREFLSAKTVRNFCKSMVEGHVSHGSLAASSMSNLVKVLKMDQLKQCGLAYINNGTVSTVVNRSIYFINPQYSDYQVEPSPELLVGLDEEEQKKVEDSITKNTITTEEGKKVDVKGLRQKLVRANVRCKLHPSSDKLIGSSLIFGTGALEIVRFTAKESPKWAKGFDNAFGEPRALRHLSSLRIRDIKANSKTAEFEGFQYDEGKGKPRDIASTSLVPAFNDDYNILENSNYSGISSVWRILEAANTIEAIIGEDMPEIARQSHAKFGVLYAGTSKKATLAKLKSALEAGSWLVHNEPNLTADIHDLSLDPNRLAELTGYLSKYITTSMNLPLFMLFEDTANFATANQAMQVYLAGMLNRYRTWFRNILEDYWYAPILADHLQIDIKDVITSPVRIKAIFPPIDFETRTEKITSNKLLQDMTVFKPSDSAKNIGEDKIYNRLRFEEQELDNAIVEQKKLDIEGQKKTNEQIGKVPPGQGAFGKKPITAKPKAK